MVKEGDVILAEVWPVGGKPPPKRRQSIGKEREKVTSFSTGPQSMPTHWKQTIFLLREPITITEGLSKCTYLHVSLTIMLFLSSITLGSVVQGHFHCRKREENSRELDVEIHYAVKTDGDATPSETVVQMYKVR